MQCNCLKYNYLIFRTPLIILVEFNITKYSDYSVSGAGTVFFSNEPCRLSYEKCISIFHLPPSVLVEKASAMV